MKLRLTHNDTHNMYKQSQRETLTMNRVQKGRLHEQFTGSTAHQALGDQRTRERHSSELLRLRRWGKGKKTRQWFPPARHKRKQTEPGRHTRGTQVLALSSPYGHYVPSMAHEVSDRMHGKRNCMSWVTSDQHSTCTSCDRISIRLRSTL